MLSGTRVNVPGPLARGARKVASGVFGAAKSRVVVAAAAAPVGAFY